MFGKKRRALRHMKEQRDLIEEVRASGKRLRAALARNQIVMRGMAQAINEMKQRAGPQKPTFDQKRAEERIEALSAELSVARLKIARVHKVLQPEEAMTKRDGGFNW